MATLARDTYREKVLGCWLGKTIGGTLGAPHEGRTERLGLKFYDPVPEGAVANDDLDLQLVWLAALRKHGPALDEHHLAEAWLANLRYPFDEYGMALWNLRRGLPPALSGLHANAFGDCMGAPIRSEIWACTAPGCPRLAAAYAYADAIVDHGGEGVWGEVFFAALQSAAFCGRDPDKLLDVGLAAIPASSRVARAVRLVREQWDSEVDWGTTRDLILRRFGHPNFTDAPQNVAFTILGWLWGRGGGDSLCKAVNCGYDTDCTGATLGALLGILKGPDAFDAKWRDPVGTEVVVGWGVTGCEVPRTLEELTDWTVDVGEELLTAHGAPVELGDETSTRDLKLPVGPQDDELAARMARHGWTVRRKLGRHTVWLQLDGPPALRAHESRQITITCDGDVPAGLSAVVGEGWLAEPLATAGESRRLRVTAPPEVVLAPTHPLSVVIGDLPAVNLAILPACGWRVAGPLEVADPGAALEELPAVGEGGEVWTPDHRLVLDNGAAPGRLLRVRTTLTLTAAQPARLVSSTPARQRVFVNGHQVLRKTEVTEFCPAAHRSGPGTTADLGTLTAGAHEVEVFLGLAAGQPARLDLFLTQPDAADGERLLPLADVVYKLPRRVRILP